MPVEVPGSSEGLGRSGEMWAQLAWRRFGFGDKLPSEPHQDTEPLQLNAFAANRVSKRFLPDLAFVAALERIVL